MKAFKTILAIAVLALLAACAQKKTPEEVANGFWQAVIHNDLDIARKLATKDSQKDLDLLDNREQMLKAVEIGSATIDQNDATVPTTLIGDSEGKPTRIELITYLRQEEEQWKVDGSRTVNALMTSSLQNLLNNLTGDLSQLGDALSKTITTGLQEFLGQLQQSVPTLKQELGKLTDEEKARSIGQELGNLFSQGLRDAMKEFSQGLDELERELQDAAEGNSDRK